MAGSKLVDSHWACHEEKHGIDVQICANTLDLVAMVRVSLVSVLMLSLTRPLCIFPCIKYRVNTFLVRPIQCFSIESIVKIGLLFLVLCCLCFWWILVHYFSFMRVHIVQSVPLCWRSWNPPCSLCETGKHRKHSFPPPYFQKYTAQSCLSHIKQHRT